MAVWRKPAKFWIGVGGVAEGLFWLGWWLTPDELCQSFGGIVDCPLSTMMIVCLGTAIYFATAWAAHRLGVC